MLEGIKQQVKEGTKVTYTKGCDLVDANWPESEIISYPLTAEEKNEIQKAVDNVKESDVAVVVLGGGIRTCGENKSRTSLDLPDHQQQLLEAIVATGKPVVLVLINGRRSVSTGPINLYRPFWRPGTLVHKEEQLLPKPSSEITIREES